MTPASCTTFFSVLCKFFKDLFLECLGSSRKRMQRYELFLNWQIFLQEIFNKKQKKYLRLIFVKVKTDLHLIILYSMPGLSDLNYIVNLGGDSIWLESNPLLTRAKSRFDSIPPLMRSRCYKNNHLFLKIFGNIKENYDICSVHGETRSFRTGVKG